MKQTEEELADRRGGTIDRRAAELAGINTAQAQLEPTLARISTLQSDLDEREALGALARDGEALAAQEKRLVELTDAS